MLQDALYIFGGYDGSNVLSSCEVYDPASDRWRAIAPMGSKRSALAAAVVGGLLYVIGGKDGSNHLSSCEVYDPGVVTHHRKEGGVGCEMRYTVPSAGGYIASVGESAAHGARRACTGFSGHG